MQDAKRDLAAFNEMLETLPGPLGRTTSVEACVTAFVEALEKRKRHAYVPGWVGAIAQSRTLVTSRLGARETRKHVPACSRSWTKRCAAWGGQRAPVTCRRRRGRDLPRPDGPGLPRLRSRRHGMPAADESASVVPS
jgi:hypothetical protein